MGRLSKGFARAFGGSTRGQVNPATRNYIAAVCGGAALVAFVAYGVGGEIRRPGALVVFTLLGIASRRGPRNEVVGRISLSLLSGILLSAILIVGPLGAALLALVVFVPEVLRLPPRVLLFNAGMVSVMTGLAGIAYVLAGGSLDFEPIEGGMALVLTVGLPLVVADVVMCVSNAALLSGVVHFSQGAPFRAQLATLLSSTGLLYVAYGIVAFLFAILWIPARLSAFSAVLMIPPLLVARWAFAQYGNEVTAHERSLDALVAALEKKSPGSVGHSSAVAHLCVRVAEEMALPAKEVEALRVAGMLHDVGLLALPSALLRPEHVLTTDEARELVHHTDVAVRMLTGISFLEPAIPAIAHHHERVDGTGYPHGISGSQIPLPGRILAVTDAYHALTTPRLDRPALTPMAALARIEAMAGSAFDGAVVDALARAVIRNPVVSTDPPSAPVAGGSAVAHDDPISAPALHPEVRA